MKTQAARYRGCMATTTEPRHAFQWSDLSRHSTEVGNALDEYGEVTVTRGAQSLRLAPSTEPEIVEVTRALCSVLARLVELGKPDLVKSVLGHAWPWTQVLPEDDQLTMAGEVASSAEICESVGTWQPFITAIEDWRRTARAWAQGDITPTVIDEPLDTVVQRPG